MTAIRKNLLRCLPLVVLALAAALVWAAPAEATKKLAQEMDLVCTTCHDKPGSKLLTDEGKFFETLRTLDGYDELMETFNGCTHCHTQKPGSMKLTKAGKQHQKQLDVDDMEELCALIKKHPDVDDHDAEASPEADKDVEASADTADTR